MNIIFGIFGAIAYLASFWVFAESRSAIHENLAVNLMVVGTIFIVGAGIISTLEKIGLRSIGNPYAGTLGDHTVSMATVRQPPQESASQGDTVTASENSDEQITCPRCGNQETVTEPWNPKSYQNFTANRSLFSLAMKLRCNKCSHELCDSGYEPQTHA